MERTAFVKNVKLIETEEEEEELVLLKEHAKINIKFSTSLSSRGAGFYVERYLLKCLLFLRRS